MQTPDLSTRFPRPRRHARRQAGFTLIEAALTTVIVGTGVLAIVAAQQAYHMKNDWAQRSGTAMLLANEIREMSLPLPHHDPITGNGFLGPEANEYSGTDPDPALFDDLDDFAGDVDVATGIGTGLTFNPPINALGLPIADLTKWEQRVTVESVLSDNIATNFVQPLGTTDMMRVTVRIMHQGPRETEMNEITRLVWVVSD